MIKYDKTFMKLHFCVDFEYFKLRAFKKRDPALRTLIEKDLEKRPRVEKMFMLLYKMANDMKGCFYYQRIYHY